MLLPYEMKRAFHRRRGVTLIEALAVIAIIAITASVTFSVVAKAKEKAKEAPCAGNMRQLGLALEMYRGDSDGKYPLMLNDLVSANAAVKPSLACPSDTSKGANAAETDRTKGKVSVYYWSPYPNGVREALEAADSNHAVAYCVLHGQRLKPGPFPDPRLDSVGTVVRLLADGSVKKVEVGMHCGSMTNGSMLQLRTEWSLLTDAPCTDGNNCQFAPNSCKDTRE